MKRPRTLHIRRPKAAGSGTARTSKEAAIQLVRLEFDISRLEQAITQAEARADLARRELTQQQSARHKLMSILRA
jgi:hypothetical protein